MAFFDDLKEKVQGITKTGVEKSKQLGEMAKLKASNIGEEDTIKKAYLALGKLYYAERGMDPEAAYADLCAKITAAKVNIEENQNRIEQLKNESGVNDLADNMKDAGAAFAEQAKNAADGIKAKIDEAIKPNAGTTDSVVVEKFETVTADTAETTENVVTDTMSNPAEENKDEFSQD